MKKNDKNNQIAVALEVCHSMLHMVVSEVQDNDQRLLRTCSVPWRHDSAFLHSQQGIAELSAAFKQLANQYKLQGIPIHVALTGDYCVTRVVTGEIDHVQRELKDLEQRSSLYLSLGLGPKINAVSVRNIDARHQHALLTVVNQKTIQALLEAAQRAGIQLQRIEPSLVSLSRLIGHMGGDKQSPALIVNLGEQSVCLGITHQGQLLLDYRPAGQETRSKVASIASHHLARLQRYCNKLNFAQGRLEYVFLEGESEDVRVVTSAFQEQKILIAVPLDPLKIDSRWSFIQGDPGPELTTALGTYLLTEMPETHSSSPNLLEHLNTQNQESLLPLMVKSFWLLAASLLMTIATWGLVIDKKVQCQTIEQELSSYDLQTKRTQFLWKSIVQKKEKIDELKRIDSALVNPAWDQFTTTLGQCLPEDVWLDSFHIASDGVISLKGSSYSENGVFEFIRWLRKAPIVEHVALNGTRSKMLRTGPVTEFDVRCDVVGRNDSEGDVDDES